MKIGNTNPSPAIIAAFSGIDDRTLKNKIAVIKKGLALHIPDPDDPIDVLSKVGGLTCLFLDAAVYMELLDFSNRTLVDIKTFGEVGIHNAQ